MFITSGHFVNAYNDPQYYLFATGIFCLSIIFPWVQKNIALPRVSFVGTPFLIVVIAYMTTQFGAFNSHWVNVLAVVMLILLCIQLHHIEINYQWVLGGLEGLGTALAIYGLLQYVGWIRDPTGFTMTGAFDNPIGFAATLALMFPAGLYLFLTMNRDNNTSSTKRNNRKIYRYIEYLIGSGLAVISLAIILSGSRTAMLAVLVSSGLLVVLETKLIYWIKTHVAYGEMVVLLCIIILLGGTIFGLYQLKEDSANGRLLIWRISADMIIDRPLLGHGQGAFQAKYMDYQAAYFNKHPESPYRQLADNTKHPFNEFILIAVEYGVVGLSFVLLFLFFLFRNIVLSNHPLRFICISSLVGFLVISCLSYPLQYVSVWLLVIFYAVLTTKTVHFSWQNRSWALGSKIIVTSLSLIALFLTVRQAQAQIKWSNVASRALSGEVQTVLPEYRKLYSYFKKNPLYLYNYGAILSLAEEYDRSITILEECKNYFNDYDLQILLARNYKNKANLKKAENTYKYAANMVPNRFWPLYQLVKLYRRQHKIKKAHALARQIIHKKVKVPSVTIASMKSEMGKFLEGLNTNY